MFGVKNWDHPTQTLHMSYHMGEHYNSVRLMDDPGTDRALPIPETLE